MKITKELLREMIKEEIAALKEEKSFIGKIKYAPAEALMAIEREIRKQTGIRGVLDPSVIYDNEGNLIIPEPDKLKDWQKDYPALYAATQAATNMFASDPLSLAATLTGVGGVASKAASKLAKVAKGTKGYTPVVTKQAGLAGGAKLTAQSTWQGAKRAMDRNNVPISVQDEVATLFDRYWHQFVKPGGNRKVAVANAKRSVIKGLNNAIRRGETTEAQLRAYQQFMQFIGNQYPSIAMRMSGDLLRKINNRLLLMYSDELGAASRMAANLFKGKTYKGAGGIHDWHLLPIEQLAKLKDVIKGTHQIDWNTLTVVAKRGFGG